MFPYTDPQTVLDLHHQHVAELSRQAAGRRLARSVTRGAHRRLGRWPRRRREAPAARAATA